MIISCISCGEYHDTSMREAYRRGRLCPSCYDQDHVDERVGRCEGCGATWTVYHVVYRCPRCGHSLRETPEGEDE